MSFLKGYGIGLAMVMFIGPVVFTLLKASLQKGTHAGIMVALGIVASDIVVVLICLAGAIPFFENESNQFWIALFGSVLLLLLGLKYIFRPESNKESEKKIGAKDVATSFSNGFFVNLINPFVFMVWIGIIVLAESNYGNRYSLYLFLGAILLGIFSQDLFKVFFAKKIKPFLNPKRLVKIYKVLGFLMLAFALRLFLFALSVQ